MFLLQEHLASPLLLRKHRDGGQMQHSECRTQLDKDKQSQWEKQEGGKRKTDWRNMWKSPPPPALHATNR